MSHVLDQYSIREIEHPPGDPALEGFTSGASVDEVEVNAIIERVYYGDAPDLRVLAVESSTHDVIGLGGFWGVNLQLPDQTLDATYIGFLAISEKYRGSRLASGAGIGDLLLSEVLHSIARSRGGVAPAIWTLVHRDNRVANRLFARHGFAPIGASGDYEPRFRPPELPI
jgi:ribosomal protein S18 acetylase RimI-like enzyme